MKKIELFIRNLLSFSKAAQSGAGCPSDELLSAILHEDNNSLKQKSKIISHIARCPICMEKYLLLCEIEGIKKPLFETKYKYIFASIWFKGAAATVMVALFLGILLWFGGISIKKTPLEQKQLNVKKLVRPGQTITRKVKGGTSFRKSMIKKKLLSKKMKSDHIKQEMPMVVSGLKNGSQNFAPEVASTTFEDREIESQRITSHPSGVVGSTIKLKTNTLRSLLSPKRGLNKKCVINPFVLHQSDLKKLLDNLCMVLERSDVFKIGEKAFYSSEGYLIEKGICGKKSNVEIVIATDKQRTLVEKTLESGAFKGVFWFENKKIVFCPSK